MGVAHGSLPKVPQRKGCRFRATARRSSFISRSIGGIVMLRFGRDRWVGRNPAFLPLIDGVFHATGAVLGLGACRAVL